MSERYYLDCEFDGHGGSLLSMALVREDGASIYIRLADALVFDKWVAANVWPLMDKHEAKLEVVCLTNEVGSALRSFITGEHPIIIADSPVDIGRFCVALSTGSGGGWQSTDYARLSFEVHNVDCYPTDLPGAVQHNAWWDAMALRDVLARSRRVGGEKG